MVDHADTHTRKTAEQDQLYVGVTAPLVLLIVDSNLCACACVLNRACYCCR
jgi:hypothetical protein